MIRKGCTKLAMMLFLMGIIFVGQSNAATFTTTTTTGYTTTGYFENTVYDLEWEMLWFDNSGWKPLLSLMQVITNGVAWIDSSLLNVNASNLTEYGTIYRLDLPDILDANNVEITLEGRNSNADDALFGYDFHIYMQGTSGNAEVNFIGHPSVGQYTRLAAGDSTTQNNGALVRRFTTWEDISLKVDNGTVSAIVDGNIVLTRNFNGDLGKLVQIQLDFRGSARVDNFSVYENGIQRVFEDFNTIGQTTAQLVTSTGYLISTGLTGNTVTTGLYITPNPALYFSGYGKATDDGFVQERIQSQQKPLIKNNEVEVIHNTEEIVKEEDEADPISLHHGAMVYNQTLMQLPSKGKDLMFMLQYNSILDYDYTPLGKGWDHNFNKFLAFSEYDNKLYFDNGMGIPSSFISAGDNIWESDALRATVLKLPNNDMRMTFVNGGSIRFRPIRLGYQEIMYRPYVITDRNGQAQFLSWSNNDLLQSVEDSSGNKIDFTYNSNDKLTRVEEIGGRKIDLSYDINNDLINIAVTHAGNIKSTAFTYSSGFPSNQDELNHNMLTITDSKGQVYVNNTYDTNDAVTQQVYGGDTYSYNYTRDNTGRITKVDVNNGRNVQTSYTFTIDGLVTKRERTTTNGGSEIYTMTYTNDGRMTSYAYPSGRNVSYTYDSLGRVATRTVAAGLLSQQWTYSYVGDTTRIASMTEPNGQVTQFNYDAKGNLVKTTQLNVDTGNGVHNLETTYSYDSEGQLEMITDSEGLVTEMTYDTQGNMLSITQAGERKQLLYDNYGNSIAMIDEEGYRVQLSYDAFDQLVEIVSPEGVTRGMSYDDTNNMIAMQQALLGNSVDTTMTYDILDRLVSRQHEQSSTQTQQTQWTYEAHDIIKTVIQPNGTRTVYEYDHNDQIVLAEITDGAMTKKYRYSYDDNGQLIGMIEPNGGQTQRERDGLGRIITKRDAKGTETVISYNQQNLPDEIRIENNFGVVLQKTTYRYNTLGWLLDKNEYTIAGTERSQGTTPSQITYNHQGASVYTTSYSYNKRGQKTTMTNPRGGIVQMRYDSKARLAEVEDTLGNITFYSYDKRDLLTHSKLIATNGAVYSMSYVYDKDGRVVETINNDGKSSVYVYNELNQLIESEDENGNRTTMTYDYVGNMTTSTQYLQAINSNGNSSGSTTSTPVTTTYEYDIMNNMIAMIDAEGNRSTFVYDGYNRKIEEIYPDGRKIIYDYDVMDNVIKTVDPNGTIVENTYDILNRMVQRDITPAGRVGGVTYETYDYDELGRLVGGNDDRQQAIYFSYDGLDRVIRENNNGKYVHYEYDGMNNMTKVIYPSTKELVREFDDGQRLTSMDWVAYNQRKTIIENSYDSIFLRESSFGNDAKTRYDYDNLMRVKSIDHYQSSHPMYNNAGQIIEDLAYSYDDVSNVLSDGERDYTIDSLYRVTEAIYPANQARSIKQEKMMYDLVGNRTQFESWTQQGNGGGNTNGGNGNGNNGNGNGNGNNGNGNNGNGNGNNGNGNNGNGNVGGNTNGGGGGTPGILTYQGLTSYTANNLNQYTSITYPQNPAQQATVQFVYDKNGNILQDDKWEYQYDYRNRLIRAEHMQNGEVLTFEYDVLNRRTEKTNRSKGWKWVYTFHDVIEEDGFANKKMNSGSIKVKEYVYGNGLDDVVYMEDNRPLNYNDEQQYIGYTEVYGNGFAGGVKGYYFQKDLSGSTKIITDNDGKVIEMYAYDSFGRIYERSGISQNYRPFQTSRVGHKRFFTGREYDEDLQLYYYRARWYSPALGRFMSRDPLGYADGVNLYAYVSNNPMTFVDPWGTEKQVLPGPSREGKKFSEMSWTEVGQKIYDQWDWQELGDEYVESSEQFVQPFVDTAQCFQEDVLVCSAETFTPYGDVVVIDEYVTNFDDMTLGQKVGNGVLVVGAIITPGNKKTNQGLKSQAKDVIQTVNSLALEANFKRFMSKIPANAKSNVKITTSANNITIFTATSPGKVPGSYAIYEKTVDANGNTISYLKTTVDPNGNIVHTKDKMNN